MPSFLRAAIPSVYRLYLLFGWGLAMTLTPVSMAEVSLAPPFAENAVLQRGKPVPIWGKASPGETVTVKFQAQTKQTSTDESGRWKVLLDPLTATDSPSKLLVQGTATEAPIELGGILVGDVWLCSGQSNMAWPVSRSSDYTAEAAGADLPAIRFFKVAEAASSTPADSLQGAWQVCSRKTFGGFSAVSYYFARDIHREVGVPIGIINSSWGGTEIEPWISGDALKSDPAFSQIEMRDRARQLRFSSQIRGYERKIEQYAAAKAKAEAEGVEFNTPPPRKPEDKVSRRMPSALFNAMIHPMVPNAIKGFLWYQGESNVGRHDEYRTLFPSLIRQWRRDFGQGDLPFYFVQLSAWGRKGGERMIPALREAQTKALDLPNSAMAVSIDVGDPMTVHPANKREVGRRLALIALAKTYGKEGAFSGPIFREAKGEGPKVRLRFDHAEGLQVRNGVPNGFEIAGEDRKFVPADATVDGTDVLVSAKEVPSPIAVRYAFLNFPSVSLYNGAGLPAAPFRTDEWPIDASPDTGEAAATKE